MTYTIKYDSGQEKQLTDREVRDLIIFDLQHDMASEYTDQEIEKIVNEANPDDYFFRGEYASGDYTIIKQQGV